MEGCLPHRGTVGSKGCSLSQEQEGESQDLGRVCSFFLPSLGPAAPGSRAALERHRAKPLLAWNKRSAFDPRPPRVHSLRVGSCASAQNVLRCPGDPTLLPERPSHRGQRGPGGGEGCRVTAGGGLGVEAAGLDGAGGMHEGSAPGRGAAGTRARLGRCSPWAPVPLTWLAPAQTRGSGLGAAGQTEGDAQRRGRTQALSPQQGPAPAQAEERAPSPQIPIGAANGKGMRSDQADFMVETPRAPTETLGILLPGQRGPPARLRPALLGEPHGGWTGLEDAQRLWLAHGTHRAASAASGQGLLGVVPPTPEC